MPILKPNTSTAPVFYPTENYTLVKYMDLQRFISMLYKKSLFFCRVDKLEDKFEGSYPLGTYEKKIQAYTKLRDSGFFKFDLSDEKIKQEVAEGVLFDKQQKALYCVCCWNKKKLHESAALWKIYSDFDKGIMIQTDFDSLNNAFENTFREIQVNEVQYVAYDVSSIPYGNTNYAFLYKHHAYHYEDEVRLLYTAIPKEGWVYEWEKQEVVEGKYIDLDLHKLIHKIVIGPHSPRWYSELVQDIIYRYGLDIKVTQSELTII